MKYIFNLFLVLLGTSLIGDYYLRFSLTTQPLPLKKASEYRSSIKQSASTTEDLRLEMEAALASERRATDARDSLQSLFTRLHYLHEDLQMTYNELRDSLRDSRVTNRELRSRLRTTEEILGSKKDSLQYIQQQYFDRKALHKLLAEENAVLQQQLDWQEREAPRLVRWLIALVLVLFAVTGGLLVHIQQRQQ